MDQKEKKLLNFLNNLKAEYNIDDEQVVMLLKKVIGFIKDQRNAIKADYIEKEWFI